ncbi:MAG: hypothetical protein ACRDGI_07165, partial [Candidatus Limnocylindrales bacterium]
MDSAMSSTTNTEEPSDELPTARGAGVVVPVTIAVIALLVYVRTVMPGVAFGDWGEMATVPHVLGVAHPTGYPTYIV